MSTCIRNLGEGLYEVQSETTPSEFYVVDLRDNSCTCPHFTYRGAHCKHLRSAEAQQNRDHVLDTLECLGFIDLADQW